jgi:hypothetical protein
MARLMTVVYVMDTRMTQEAKSNRPDPHCD